MVVKHPQPRMNSGGWLPAGHPGLRKRATEVEEVYASMPQNTDPVMRIHSVEEKSLTARIHSDFVGTMLMGIGGVIFFLLLVLLCRAPTISRRDKKELESLARGLTKPLVGAPAPAPTP
eukprot:Hpha_TRINITY_DN19438_c0_g1::TRINITY_DN19438_c0_g1_i1::g.45738::m.45738